jgi:hypothetical protein
MKKYILTLLFFISHQSIAHTAFFYGFDVERITGIHETEIESYGCKYTVDDLLIKKSFSLIGVNEKSSYDHENVRAKVILDGEIYFIDKAGNARSSKDSYVVDKEIFIGLITLEKNCAR